MRELNFDHVTPFRPITRLNFWIIKFLRGYPYKKYTIGFVIYGWGLSYLGGICHMWGGLSYMGGVCQIWAPYTEVLWWNTSRIIIIWDLSPRFVIYGEYPRFDKSHPCMTNPSTPRWVGKTQAVFSTNERARFWSCDPFSTNHKAQFLDYKILKGLPLQKIHNRVCHIWVGFVISGWDLSYVGGFVIYGYKVIFATYFITVPE